MSKTVKEENENLKKSVIKLKSTLAQMIDDNSKLTTKIESQNQDIKNQQNEGIQLAKKFDEEKSQILKSHQENIQKYQQLLDQKHDQSNLNQKDITKEDQLLKQKEAKILDLYKENDHLRSEFQKIVSANNSKNETEIKNATLIEELKQKNKQLDDQLVKLNADNSKLMHALNLQSSDMEKMIQEIDRLKPYQKEVQLAEQNKQDYNQLLQETMWLKQDNDDLKHQLQLAVRSPPDQNTVQVTEIEEQETTNAEVQYLKHQIAELNAQKVKYEELYLNLKRENSRAEAELKQSQMINSNNQLVEENNAHNIVKYFAEISTLKAKLMTSQTQFNQAEANHQLELEKIDSLNNELNTKMKNEISALKKEKMELLKQTQTMLSKNADLKRNLTTLKAKSMADE